MEVKSSSPTDVVEPSVAAEHPRRRVQSFAVDFYQAFRKHRISMLAKQAAYSLLYAIPSMLIVLVSLAAIVDKETDIESTQAIQDFIDEHIPTELQPLLHSLVDKAIVDTSQSAATITALISLGIAIWSGAGAVGALMFSCNLVYDIEESRSWFRRSLLKVLLMIAGGVGMVLGFVLFTFGQRIGEWIDSETGRSSMVVSIFTSGQIWSLVLVFGSLLMLYLLAPDLPISFRWLVPGSLLATLFIAITFAALDVVLTIYDPGGAYGAASSVLVLLWTLYVMSVIIIGGAVINAFIARRYDRKMATFLHEHPERRRGLHTL